MWYFQELDFIYAMYGAIFFVMGGVGWLLASRRDENILPWNLLALISLIHGLNEWVFFFGVLFGGWTWFHWLPIAFISAAFLVLLALVRATFANKIKERPVSAYTALALSVIIMCWLYTTGHAVLVRYSLSLGGGFFIAVIFWRAGAAKQSFALRLTAIPLAAYAFTGIIVLLPSEFYRHSDSYAQFWAYAQLLRAISMLSAGLCLWHYAVITRATPPDTTGSRKPGFRELRVSATAIILIIGLGWLLTFKLGERQAASHREAMLSLAETLASSLNIRQRAELKNLSERLERVTSDQRYFARLYVLEMRAEGLAPILNVRSPHHTSASPFISLKDAVSTSPALRALLGSGKAGIIGPMHQDSATRFFALVPIRMANGTILAYLGADIDDYNYELQLRHARGIGIFITALLLFVIIVYALGQEKMRDNRNLVDMSELRYKNIFLQNRAVMLLIDPATGAIREANAAAAQYYGYPPEKMPGMLMASLIRKSREEETDKYRQIIEQKGSSFTDTHLIADGNLRDVEVFAVPVTAEKTYIFLIIFDISERVRAQKELNARVEFLKVLVEAIPIPLLVKDLHGRYLDCNSAFCRVMGQPRERVLGKTVSDLQPPDNADFFMGKDADLLREEGGTQQFEHDMTVNGELRCAIFSRAIFHNADGSKGGILAVIQDTTELITAYRKLENAIALQRTLTELAEAGSRAKTDFLAMMSHEIRTPLNSIIGFTELLLSSGLSEKQREFMEAVHDSGRNLLALISNILDLSKIEVDKLELEKRPFLLTQCLEDVTQMLSVHAREKGLPPIKCRLDPSIPEVLITDSGRLTQILLNLAGNAIKFTDKGEVSIQVSAIRCEENGEEKLFQLHFSVSDTGPGIEPDALTRIFQPFTQGDSSTTRRFGGTGLGLTIAKRLCALFNGRLWVESAVGKGSTFHFTIKAQGRGADALDQTENERGTALKTRENGRKAHILAVEDNPVNRKLLGSILDKMGHSVSFAKCGREAVEAARMGGCDLILMDLEMPDMDGYEATRLIRAEECAIGALPVPIVALTAHATTGDRRLSMQSGMQDYLSKPVMARDLSNAIVRWMEPLYPVFVLCLSARESLQMEQCLDSLDGIIPHFSLLHGHTHLLFARKYFAAVLADASFGEAKLAEFIKAAKTAGQNRAIPFIVMRREGIPCDEKPYLDMGFEGVLSYAEIPERIARLVKDLPAGNTPPA